MLEISLNQYGDKFKPTKDGHGVDIASQRQDELDIKSVAYVRERLASGHKVKAVDLGGGFGTHSINLAEAGAQVTMVDLADTALGNFNKAIAEKRVASEDLKFIQKDFSALSDADDIPKSIDLLYSQRALHYLPYQEAKKVLSLMFSHMTKGGEVFISMAGYDTEYGKTYPDRDKKVEDRYNFVTPDMQEKHGITHKIVTYTEQELEKLLKSVGYTDVNVTRSAFGNIKATAYKPAALAEKPKSKKRS
ncbi:MAG: class I SAM-dependent methyltransferase [Alphaproteobacteria bacterium]|nr:class I SAM-dependent methyltransferase [Alphaproteobacteria bacterium]